MENRKKRHRDIDGKKIGFKMASDDVGGAVPDIELGLSRAIRESGLRWGGVRGWETRKKLRI